MIFQKIKDLFVSSVEHICSLNPHTDFKRNKKIPPQTLISYLVSQDSSSTRVEMLDFCEYTIRSVDYPFYYIEKGVMWNDYNGDFDVLPRAICIWQSAYCTHYPLILIIKLINKK